MGLQIRLTKDGSQSIYSDRFKQLYHSEDGAISESLHVFFKYNRIDDLIGQKGKLNILEIGFGTGLNLLILIDKWMKSGRKSQITYQSVEGFPITSQTAHNLNYWQNLKNPEVKEILPEIFRQLSNRENIFTLFPGFELHLFKGLFEDETIQNFKADAIFFDAFSPEANPELWSATIFRKLIDYSKPETIMTTYCAATKARAAMAAAGWFVARAPGALGKREMTMASLSESPLTGFKRVNEKRLAERYNSGEFDNR